MCTHHQATQGKFHLLTPAQTTAFLIPTGYREKKAVKNSFKLMVIKFIVKEGELLQHRQPILYNGIFLVEINIRQPIRPYQFTRRGSENARQQLQ